MMQRRTLEQAMRLREFQTVPAAPHLEHAALQNYRDCYGHEHATDQQEQEFALEQNGDRTQRSAQREGSRVTHEDLGGMGIVPEKTNARAKQRGAEHGELASASQIIDLQILTGVNA